MSSYQGGTLGCMGASSTLFMLLMGRGVFLTSLSIVVGNMEQASWLAIVVQGLIEFIVCLTLINVALKSKCDFYGWLKDLLGIYLAKLVIVFYLCTFFVNTIGLMRQYAENTVTTSMPDLDFFVAVVWYGIATCIICSYGFECIGRACSIILPIVLASLFLIFFLLHPYFLVYHLVPWQGPGLTKVIYEGAMGAGFNFGAMMLILLAPSLQNAANARNSLYFGLGGAVIVKMIYVVIYLLVFGTIVGSEKTMPFFEMTRLVYLNRYVQRIESLMILLWVIFGLVSLSISLYVALYLFAKLLELPAINPITPLFIIMIGDIAALPENISEIIYWENFFINYIAFTAGIVLPIALLIIWWIKKLIQTKVEAEA